jgi:NADH-quinone oxidoreductase subunit N
MTVVAAVAQAAIKNPAIDYHAIAPELVLSGTIFAVLMFDLMLPIERKWMSMVLASLGMAGTFAATLTLIGSDRVTFGGSYRVDDFAVLFKVFFTAAGMVILLLSLRYFREGRFYQGEYYFLLLCSFLGMLTMASSRDLLMLFISLELVSAPGFLLAGLRKADPRSNEAALKDPPSPWPRSFRWRPRLRGSPASSRSCSWASFPERTSGPPSSACCRCSR